MLKKSMFGKCASVVIAAALAGTATAQTPDFANMQGPEMPDVIADDGTVSVQPFDLPPSDYLSDEAKAALPREPKDDSAMIPRLIEMGQAGRARAMTPQIMAPQIEASKARFGVKTEDGEIAGVRAVFATPDNMPAANADKILLNFPGGGFVMGEAGGTGMVESVPLAAMAGVKIVSITYRQAPEYKFPAASEDVEKVYRELLKTYKPENIALFGCSAGGGLTAQSIAWLDSKGLPQPAAAGIFCASADRFGKGDSRFLDRPLNGLPPREGSLAGYLEGVDPSDPLASPVNSPELLAKFPPTLLITATRAGELSGAIETHIALELAGADSELFVWDGLGHAFFYDHDLPESMEAYTIMTRFFSEHLGLEAPAAD